MLAAGFCGFGLCAWAAPGLRLALGRRDHRFDDAGGSPRAARVAQHENRQRVSEGVSISIVVPEHDVDVFIRTERGGQLLIT